MERLVEYLKEIYIDCKIYFEVYLNNEIIFKANQESFNSKMLESKLSIGRNNFKIIAENEKKDFVKILEFCIKDKYKDEHNIKEKVIKKLLQNTVVSKEKIRDVMPEIKNNTFLITINLEEKEFEILEVLQNIYNEDDVISIIYENNILLIGNFEDIKDHVSSISETINLNMYKKCYISYCKIHEYELLNKLYKDNMYKINLAIKYNLSSIIFNYSSLLFEEVMDNLKEGIKDKIINNLNESFSKLDDDMIKTVEILLKNELNLSESAKGLYVHRNTLIYRLDKIQKYTGYDIRKFNDALLFKIAFFIWKQKNK